jgi:hypothetical protein
LEKERIVLFKVDKWGDIRLPLGRIKKDEDTMDRKTANPSAQ